MKTWMLFSLILFASSCTTQGSADKTLLTEEIRI